MHRGPEVTEGGKWNQALAVRIAQGKRGNMHRDPEVTEEEKCNQALAVGRAKRKYEQRPLK